MENLVGDDNDLQGQKEIEVDIYMHANPLQEQADVTGAGEQVKRLQTK